MIKIVSNTRIFTASITPKREKSQATANNISFGNLQLEREFLSNQEQASKLLNSGFHSLFNVLRDQISIIEATKGIITEAKTSTETKVKQEAKTLCETKVKEVIQSTKEEEDYDYYDEDEEEMITSCIPRYHNEPSVLKTIAMAIPNTILSIAEKTRDMVSNIQERIEEKKQAKILLQEELRKVLAYEPTVAGALDAKLVAKIVAKQKLSVKKLKQLQEQVNIVKEKIREQEAVKMQKQVELDLLRKNFKKMFLRYQNAFAPEDLKPRMVQFNNYMELSFTDLKSLYNELLMYLSHQREIVAKKKDFRQGAEYYLSTIKQCNDLNWNCQPLYSSNKGYRAQKNLGRLCDSFIENCQNLGNSLVVVNEIFKKYTDVSKEKLNKIFKTESPKILFKNEKISAEVQFIDQYNLVQCILQDAESIKKKYLEEKLININTCFEQLHEIKKILKQAKNKKENRDFVTILLNRVELSLNEQIEKYNIICSDYENVGQALMGICQNLKNSANGNA